MLTSRDRTLGEFGIESLETMNERQAQELLLWLHTERNETTVNVGTYSVFESAWATIEALFAGKSIDMDMFARAVNEHRNQIVVAPDRIGDGRIGFIFSEKATFGEKEDGEEAQGLGVVLPVLANNGVKVAVILSDNPGERVRQEDLMRKLNNTIDDPGKKIRFGSTLEEINNRFADLERNRPVRFYYLKTATETRIEGVIDSIDIIVKHILRILGEVSGIIQDNQELDRLYEGARLFARAA